LRTGLQDGIVVEDGIGVGFAGDRARGLPVRFQSTQGIVGIAFSNPVVGVRGDLAEVVVDEGFRDGARFTGDAPELVVFTVDDLSVVTGQDQLESYYR
jgi:hypothetical protein